MTPEVLRRHGYQPIVSEAQAAQLLRRELKHHRSWQQRNPERKWMFDDLLAFKPGNWFKFLKNVHNGYCSTIIWRFDTQARAAGGGE